MLQVTLWDNGQSVEAQINIITSTKLVSPLRHALTFGDKNNHEHPAISSQAILRGQASFYSQYPEFVVVWSNERNGGYDVYARILQYNKDGESGTNGEDGGDQEESNLFTTNFTVIIIGIIVGVILVILGICICNHFYIKHKNQRKPSKMHQLGEESEDDDDEEGGFGTNRDDTIGDNLYGDTRNDEQDDDDEDDGVQLKTFR